METKNKFYLLGGRGKVLFLSHQIQTTSNKSIFDPLQDLDGTRGTRGSCRRSLLPAGLGDYFFGQRHKKPPGEDLAKRGKKRRKKDARWAAKRKKQGADCWTTSRTRTRTPCPPLLVFSSATAFRLTMAAHGKRMGPHHLVEDRVLGCRRSYVHRPQRVARLLLAPSSLLFPPCREVGQFRGPPGPSHVCMSPLT